MSLAINQNLAAATVTYNGVQFGGADSAHQSLPPTYRYSGQFERDDAGAAIVGTRYTLSVSTTFYHTTSVQSLEQSVEDVRLKLQQPGKTLKIVGLGNSFGTISHDEKWGPMPISFDWEPLGLYSWQCTFVIQFVIKECSSHHANPMALTAFNFATSWQNDYEGICERTIDGYAEIAIWRQPGTNLPAQIADQVRDSLDIVCPVGFRRRVNTWREDYTKNRLRFVIVDSLESGTPLPVGCTAASGSVSYSSMGPGFAKSIVTMNMDLKISPAFHPSTAGIIFLGAAHTKQQELQAGIGNGTVIPKSISITNGKFDRARETSCSMTWMLSGCTSDMMKAAGIWTPLVSNNYQQWRTSVENLWNNRGAAKVNGSYVGSDPQDCIVVDLCSNITSMRIGDSGVGEQTPNNPLQNFQFTCPNIPEDGGWLLHDLRVRILRQNKQTWHKKAVPYEPSPGFDSSSGSLASGDTVSLGSYPYEQPTEETQADIEYNGLPEVWILLQFRGYRIKHLPALPIITTVAGLPAVEITSDQEGPMLAFDALNCPVYRLRGYRVYKVNGYIGALKKSGSLSSCADPSGDNKGY
jgi:hypothetical protein